MFRAATAAAVEAFGLGFFAPADTEECYFNTCTPLELGTFCSSLVF